jgi:hypothetical protein
MIRDGPAGVLAKNQISELANVPTTTAAPTAAAARAARGCRRPHVPATGVPAATSTSTTTAGTTQYRWWTHEIGLIRHPVDPVTVAPARSSPRRNSSAARHIPTTRASPASASHGTEPSASGATRRASSPRRDWSFGSVGGPTRPVCHRIPVQYRVDGSTPRPASTLTPKTPTATATARHRRVAAR